MRKERNKSVKKQGFTLVEVLVSLTILSMLISMMLETTVSFSKNICRANEQVYVNDCLQGLLNSFYSESRAVADLHSTTSNVFEFTSTSMDGTATRVRYEWNSDTKELIISKPSEGYLKVNPVPFDEVTFNYYNKHGEPVVTAYQSNVNVNAVRATFSQNDGHQAQRITQSPIIMFRNKPLI